MKKPKHWSQPVTRVHESREDRARTWAGKTANSKVRSEGRQLAAAAQDADTRNAYQAAAAKHHPTPRNARRGGSTGG